MTVHHMNFLIASGFLGLSALCLLPGAHRPASRIPGLLLFVSGLVLLVRAFQA